MTRVIAIKLLLVLGLMSAFAACGQKTDPGEYLGIRVEPSNVGIVFGPDSSCTDTNTYKQAVKARPSPAPVLARSISSYHIRFNNFILEWRSPDELIVDLIRVTLEIDDKEGKTTETVITLEGEEVENILGQNFARFPHSETEEGKALRNSSGHIVVESNSKAREASSEYSPCGLAVGGIPVADENDSFKSKVSIEVIGSRVTKGGEQFNVRQKATATAEFY